MIGKFDIVKFNIKANNPNKGKILKELNEAPSKSKVNWDGGYDQLTSDIKKNLAKGITPTEIIKSLMKEYEGYQFYDIARKAVMRFVNKTVNEGDNNNESNIALDLLDAFGGSVSDVQQARLIAKVKTLKPGLSDSAIRVIINLAHGFEQETASQNGLYEGDEITSTPYEAGYKVGKAQDRSAKNPYTNIDPIKAQIWDNGKNNGWNEAEGN